MKKVLGSMVILTLMLSLPIIVSAHTETDPYVTPLIAGGGNQASQIPVGQVLIWNDEDYLYVKYLITNPDWCLTSTHLHVATSLSGIPQKKGNPIPGKFEYSSVNDECVNEYTYPIPLSVNQGTQLFIAAHAVVRTITGYSSDIVGFASWLPDQVTMTVKYPYSGGPSYFPEVTITNDGDFNGVYEGWCADTDRTINQNTNYTANVYSSYEDVYNLNLVEYPENLDLVNWILNQEFVGKSSSCSGNYTYGDVQKAIWALIEDTGSTAGLGSWAQCRVGEILDAAYHNGDGFIPGCGQTIAVLLAPVIGTSQVIIAQVILIEDNLGCVPIYSSETAWGGQSPFPGKNWATYIGYTVQ